MSKPSRFRTALAAALLAPVLFAGSALAAALNHSTLSHRLEEIGRWANEGRWAKVGVAADRLADDLTTALISKGEIGDESSQLGATVLSFKALAASADGRRDDALWHWSLAQSLWPSLAQATLSSYGEPAALLRENRLQPEDFDACRVEGEEGAAQVAAGSDAAAPSDVIEPPVKRYTPLPHYPYGARTALNEGPVVVRVIIDEDGSVHSPVMLRYPTVALALAAAEPLQRWRFQPAKKNGEPAATYYCLEVGFEILR